MRQLTVYAVFTIFAVFMQRAEAREVYLNGVKLDTNVVLKSVTLTGCDVKVDERGDIYITAKGYNITTTPAPHSAAPPPVAPPPPPPTPPPPAPKPREQPVDLGKKTVWLVSKQTQRGIVQYDIDVLVNGVLVRKVRSIEDPVVMDITRWIKPGDNSVRLVATKNIPTRRLSQSPTDIMEIIIGEGVLGGATVSLEHVLVDWTRNAQETDIITDDFNIPAR